MGIREGLLLAQYMNTRRQQAALLDAQGKLAQAQAKHAEVETRVADENLQQTIRMRPIFEALFQGRSGIPSPTQTAPTYPQTGEAPQIPALPPVETPQPAPAAVTPQALSGDQERYSLLERYHAALAATGNHNAANQVLQNLNIMRKNEQDAQQQRALATAGTLFQNYALRYQAGQITPQQDVEFRTEIARQLYLGGKPDQAQRFYAGNTEMVQPGATLMQQSPTGQYQQQFTNPNRPVTVGPGAALVQPPVQAPSGQPSPIQEVPLERPAMPTTPPPGPGRQVTQLPDGSVSYQAADGSTVTITPPGGGTMAPETSTPPRQPGVLFQNPSATTQDPRQRAYEGEKGRVQARKEEGLDPGAVAEQRGEGDVRGRRQERARGMIRELPENERYYVDTASGELLPWTTIVGEADARDQAGTARLVPKDVGVKIGDIHEAGILLGKMSELVNGVYGPGGTFANWRDRVQSGAKIPWERFTQSDPTYARATEALKGMASAIGKVFTADRGQLSNQDQARIQNLLPKLEGPLPDTPDVAMGRLQDLFDILERNMQRHLRMPSFQFPANIARPQLPTGVQERPTGRPTPSASPPTAQPGRGDFLQNWRRP